MTWGNVTCRDKSAKVYVFPVSWNFFRTMGIKVIDGRMPTEADEKGRSLTFYGYESLQKYYEATPGDRVEVGCNSVLNPGTVIGPHSNVYPTSCVRGMVPANSIWKTGGIIVAKK